MQALTFLLRLSLAPTSLTDTHYMAGLAKELKQPALSQDNIDSVLYARISAEPNDLLPRPTDSSVRYLFGCIERVPEVFFCAKPFSQVFFYGLTPSHTLTLSKQTIRRWPAAAEQIKSTSKLLVSYLTTTLAEPDVCVLLARSPSFPLLSPRYTNKNGKSVVFLNVPWREAPVDLCHLCITNCSICFQMTDHVPKHSWP